MSSLAGDENNDLYIGSDGQLAFVTGLDAVLQDCECAMRAQRGEMVLALGDGVPTEETIWDQWKPVQFEAAARATLLGVPNVTGIKSFTLSREDGVASYVAEIESTFGPTTVSGTLSQ